MDSSANDESNRPDGQEAALAAGFVGACLDDCRARLQAIEDQQSRIEGALGTIRSVVIQIRDQAQPERLKKQWFSPAEAAEILGKRPFTVREWCRLGRINARKRPGGRGGTTEWEVSAEEIERYKNHGLLPIPNRRISSG